MKTKAILICLALVIAVGAGFYALNGNTHSCSAQQNNNKIKDIGKGKSNKNSKKIKATIKIGKKKFKAEFNKGAAAKKFTKKFPLKYKMEELNGNEKYKYVSYDLPQNEKNVRKIKAGDIMLYGSDCIVIFYKSFETEYSYTRLGKITNTKDLKKAAGKGSVIVQFKKRAK